MQLNNLTTSINSSINTSQGTSVSSTADASVVKASTGSYASGQLIEGKITDITNQQVTLELNDGTTLSGRLTSSISQAIGDNVTLLVVDNNPKTLILKLVENTTTNYSDNAINKALEAASLTKTEKNQLLIKTLLTHQMSIDKTTIQTLLRQMSIHHNIDMDVLVQMNKNNIPVTTANIENFLKSIHMEHNILKDIGSFVDDSLEGLRNLTDTNQTKEILGKLIELATNKNPQETMNNSSPVLNQTSIHQQGYGTGMESSQLPETLLDISESTSSGSKLMHSESIDILRSIDKSMNNENSLSNTTLLRSSTPMDGSFLETEIMGEMEHNIRNNTDASHIKENSPITQRDGAAPALQELVNLLSKHVELDFDNLTPQKLLISMKEALPSMDSMDVHNLLESDDFSSVLSESMKDTWGLTPKDISEFAQNHSETSSISEHVNRLVDNSNQILHMIKEESSGIQSKMSETKDFMGNFNAMFQYVPLPLKLISNQTAGELYVYKKKQSNLNSNNISVLLHLDLDHLRKTDIHINLKNNILYNKFYFETKEVEQLVSQYIGELEEVLSQKGYVVTNEIILRENNSTPIKDAIEQELKVEPLMKYNFDLKA